MCREQNLDLLWCIVGRGFSGTSREDVHEQSLMLWVEVRLWFLDQEERNLFRM